MDLEHGEEIHQAGKPAFEGDKIACFQNVYTRMRSLEGARDFFAEVTEAYAQHKISERSMRALVYCLSGYLPYLKHQNDLAIEARLEKLESLL